MALSGEALARDNHQHNYLWDLLYVPYFARFRYPKGSMPAPLNYAEIDKAFRAKNRGNIEHYAKPGFNFDPGLGQIAWQTFVSNREMWMEVFKAENAGQLNQDSFNRIVGKWKKGSLSFDVSYRTYAGENLRAYDKFTFADGFKVFGTLAAVTLTGGVATGAIAAGTAATITGVTGGVAKLASGDVLGGAASIAGSGVADSVPIPQGLGEAAQAAGGAFHTAQSAANQLSAVTGPASAALIAATAPAPTLPKPGAGSAQGAAQVAGSSVKPVQAGASMALAGVLLLALLFSGKE